MSTSFWGWVVWFLFLFALDFTIPFIGFKGVAKVTGSFLFWIVWVIVAIVSMFVIFSRWREDHGDRQGGKP